MPVRFTHNLQSQSIYFITFTCHKWRNLFSITNTYDSVYKWFDILFEKKCRLIGYVIIPNNVHILIYFPRMPKSLNFVNGNVKRFLAHEIIKRVEADKNLLLLQELYDSVKKGEREKGQRHKVFEDSFEAKEYISNKFVIQKLNYIHKNPLSKKWNLVNDFQTILTPVLHFMKKEPGLIKKFSI